MSFSQLDNHQNLAWDFDGTLHDHPKSALMHAYILAHPEKRHVIVTFRSHGWQDRVWTELAASYPDAPTAEHFDGIINMDDRTYVKYHDARRGLRPELTVAYRNYVEWKGAMCAQHGLTILIDDMTDMVSMGCTKHSIDHIHPDNL